MSAGGLSKDNKLVLHKRKYLAPVKAMRNVFRAKFLKEFQSLIKTDKIDFPINYEVRNFKLMINSIYKKKWVVFIKEKYPYGTRISLNDESANLTLKFTCRMVFAEYLWPKGNAS